MKLITAFGLASALLLLCVSTILVVKQNRIDDLTSGDFECLEISYGYNPNFYVPYLAYFGNNCQQRKKFSIVYDDNTLNTEIETGCLSHNQKFQQIIHTKTTTILSVKSSNC